MTTGLSGFFSRCYGVRGKSGAMWFVCDSGERAAELARRVDGRPVTGLHMRIWLPCWVRWFKR
jgi:hypothetical protein